MGEEEPCRFCNNIYTYMESIDFITIYDNMGRYN